ncbi:MAG TPA: DUF1801 domain-containing protein [Candidatus Saccharimonadales bacterium]|nr:DUF1801 domain-containing protein [Candidatus Saccharimonadales bacterium]
MNTNKTAPTDQSVLDFIASLNNPQKEQDSYSLITIMQDITGEPPKMWGSSMIGFGHYHYRYESGHEGDTFLLGFSPRKTAYTVYCNCYLEDYTPLLDAIGPHTLGKGCLYIKNLDTIDMDKFKHLLTTIFKDIKT